MLDWCYSCHDNYPCRCPKVKPVKTEAEKIIDAVFFNKRVFGDKDIKNDTAVAIDIPKRNATNV